MIGRPTAHKRRVGATRQAVAAIAVFASLFVVSSVPAADGASTESIRITATTPQTEYRIGDLIEYTVTVEWKSPVEFQRIEPSAELNQFEIRTPREEKERRIGRGWRRKQARYSLSTFETGEFRIPAFTVVYRLASGEEKRMPTPPVSIQVESVAPLRPDDTGIREAKPPVMPPENLPIAQILAIAGAALIAAIVAAFFIIRALRRRVEELVAGPPRPIELVARERLAAVEASDLLERNLIKEYFDEVSDIIREYLGLRYGFQGVATTTSELIEALREPLSEDGRLELVAGFSEEADMAKFARWRPDREICDRFLGTAYRVIDETTPEPLEPVVEDETDEEEFEDGEESVGEPEEEKVAER